MSTLKRKLIDPEYRNIYNAISSSVRKSLSNCTQDEPQMVANLVYNLPHAINKIRFSGTLKLSCSGIFIHATPKVTSSNFPKDGKKSVELGDLLLLLSDASDRKRAILLQAKKTSRLPIKPDNRSQHYLYAMQPHFTYIDSGLYLTGKQRRITGRDLYNGCKYLLINDTRKPLRINPKFMFFGSTSPNQTSWVAQPTWSNLSHYHSFEEELFFFILGNAGKPYNPFPHGNNRNWDRVIHDLKEVIPTKPSSLVSNSSAGTISTRGYMNCFLSGQPVKSSILANASSISGLKYYPQPNTDDPPMVPPRFEESFNDSLSGMSIIEFKWTNTQES
jgi:hypothetical protein